MNKALLDLQLQDFISAFNAAKNLHGSFLMTANGVFDPAKDGYGPGMYYATLIGGGGGGAVLSDPANTGLNASVNVLGGSSGVGPLLQIPILSKATGVIGAGGPVNSAGGNTTLTIGGVQYAQTGGQSGYLTGITAVQLSNFSMSGPLAPAVATTPSSAYALSLGDSSYNIGLNYRVAGTPYSSGKIFQQVASYTTNDGINTYYRYNYFNAGGNGFVTSNTQGPGYYSVAANGGNTTAGTVTLPTGYGMGGCGICGVSTSLAAGTAGAILFLW
jgi:hypothetical protein